MLSGACRPLTEMHQKNIDADGVMSVSIIIDGAHGASSAVTIPIPSPWGVCGNAPSRSRRHTGVCHVPWGLSHARGRKQEGARDARLFRHVAQTCGADDLRVR